MMTDYEATEAIANAVWKDRDGEPFRCPAWTDFMIPANLIALSHPIPKGPLVLLTDKGIVILGPKGDTLYDSTGGELTRERNAAAAK